MSPQHLTIGTRGSALALKQVEIVSRALKAADSSLVVEVRVIQTHGDINHQPIPLDTIGKGWFTTEIENALQHKDIDLAVHSLKDMAEDMPHELTIGAYMPREDARDVLITRHGESLEALGRGAVVGTDSARRQAQMLAIRPDLRMQSLRGNVPSRIDQLASGPYDAIVLAAAGLKRLGLEAKITRFFSVEEMTPAPGQGTLAIQARKSDASLQEVLSHINDPDTAHISHIERSFSRAVGGGCKSPTGAYATREGADCVLVAMVVGERRQIVRDTARDPWEHSTHLGDTLAKKLLTARTNEHHT